MIGRRGFVGAVAGAGAALALGADRLAALAAGGRAAAPMNLLVLGGTGFIGPHLVRHAVSRGHRVTVFTRGRREADLPAEVVRLVGDRNGQLQALEGGRWDAVIDDSATNPDWVRQSAELLRNRVGRYLYTSSTGVYYPYLARGLDESVAPRLDADDPQDGSASYGVQKAKSEALVREIYGERALIVRPTYIIGPGDTTDRFPYWPVRLARGGEVLAPGRRDDPVQFIDVRDLVEWNIRLLEAERAGVFNAAGPAQTMFVPEFLEAARAAIGATVTFTWVDDYDFLREHRIFAAIPWAMLAGNNDGMMSIDNRRAIGAGLTFRPLAQTVRDTLAWWPTVPAERRASPRFAISPETEAAALAAWHARG